MKTRYQLFILISFLLIHTNVKAQAPSIIWQKSYGGTNDEFPSSIKQTFDGGFIVVGTSSSIDGDVSGNHGRADYWIVKTDINGNIQWQKSYGGPGNDIANDILQTADSGYIIAGSTDSTGGDVGPMHNGIGPGVGDFWIVKIDFIGNIQWQKCFGGTNNDGANSIDKTYDGGYIVAGQSNSNDGDVIANHSFGNNNDFWVIKLDGLGSIEWQKCLGGLLNDVAFAIQKTIDSGYIVVGFSNSNEGDLTNNNGAYDYWIVKLDNAGSIDWQKSFGGMNGEFAQSVQQTSDGGYIVAGYTNSNDQDVSGNNGGFDYWIIKLNVLGSIQWSRCFGGANEESLCSVKETNDSGFIIGGYSNSNVGGNHGNGDYWILKLDMTGSIQWQKCYGGTNDEAASYLPVKVELTTDGDCIISGFSNSNDGDVSGNHGGWDYWIVKLDKVTDVNNLNNHTNELIVFPSIVYDKIYIEQNNDETIELAFFDILGKEVINKFKITNRISEKDISNLKEGIYFIHAKTPKWEITKKVVVQR